MAADPEVDVEALVREVRAAADEARQRAGASRLPPWESDAELQARRSRELRSGADPGGALGSGSEFSFDRWHSSPTLLAQMALFLDPSTGSIGSHRAGVGGLIVAVKRLVRRLLTPVLERQAAFNRAALAAATEQERAFRAELGTLSRRVMELEERRDVAPSAPGSMSPSGSALGEDEFDRRAFEDAFRGSREHVLRSQARYLEYFRHADAGPVLDLGCGRGEFLGLLRDAAVVGIGVERDPTLAEAARADGLDVREGDALSALESAAERSLGGVVAFQVVEHLPFWKIVRLVELARSKLRPGGRLILESVNVQSLITWTRAWSLDPTHRQPVHPLMLRFLVEQAGFTEVELVFAGEVEPELRLEEGEGREARNARRLNDLLFAPQDYAVVARA